MSRPAIEPWFAPGSGWYTPGMCALGSLKDVEERTGIATWPRKRRSQEAARLRTQATSSINAASCARS